MAYPIITPQELSLPLLNNLLCGRGAKRQVPAGSRFLLPRCWTKTHPAAWLSLEAGSGSKWNRPASKSSLSLLVDPLQPPVFWWQQPWGSEAVGFVSVQAFTESNLCPRWVVPVAS